MIKILLAIKNLKIDTRSNKMDIFNFDLPPHESYLLNHCREFLLNPYQETTMTFNPLFFRSRLLLDLLNSKRFRCQL